MKATYWKVRLARWVMAALLLAGPGNAVAAEPAPSDRAPQALFDQVWRLARDDFLDPDMNGLDWDAVGGQFRRQVEARPAAWVSVANAMLGQLGTSHTQVYADDEPAYYQLLGVFADYIRSEHQGFYNARFGDDPVQYPGIGLFTAASESGSADNEVVVTGVLESLPAHAAGVRVGDVLLAVNDAPFQPVRSFSAAVDAGLDVEISVRRQEGSAPLALRVTPRMLDAETMFVDAMRASATVVQQSGVDVGYVHAWSYSGTQYQDVLEELVRFGGPLADADALVLDLRGGWGGASTEYLRLFLRDVPVLSMRSRGGEWTAYDSQWRKPVVALINGGTRSGKETLAWGFRHHEIGLLVGETTAGAVVGGRPHLLADGSLLYLAVADARVGGASLEGRGVAPDIVVPFDPRYAVGSDPQRARAISEAADLVRQGKSDD